MLAAANVPALLNGIIPIGVGIVTTLMGFGIVPASLDAKKAAKWQGRWGGKARLGGPLVILVGIVQLVRALYWP